jgi:hypothetical protein
MTIALEPGLAATLAQLALAGVEREFPNKPEHVLFSGSDAHTPRELHPAFYGCYDWHSAVHSHWLLVRVARLFPALHDVSRIRAVLASHLTQKKIAAEIAYVLAPGRESFERPYGWAWLFKLVQELREWQDADAVLWLSHLDPLAQILASRFADHLSRQHYPVRSGVHSNTAFAMGMAWDYGAAAGGGDLLAALEEAARRFFAADRDAPARWEPNGNDFLSPCLVEAGLMRRVMQGIHYARWLEGFLPGLATVQPANLLTPVSVSDRGDAQGVHLDGLNLSRAWCLRTMAHALAVKDARRPILIDSAGQHLRAGLRHVQSGDFLGEHWLGSFALLASTS